MLLISVICLTTVVTAKDLPGPEPSAMAATAIFAVAGPPPILPSPLPPSPPSPSLPPPPLSPWGVIALADFAPANDSAVGVREGEDGAREVFFKPVPNNGSLPNHGNGDGASAFEIRIVAPSTGDFSVWLSDRPGNKVFSNSEGSECWSSNMDEGETDSFYICSSDPRSSATNPDAGTPDLSSCSTYHSSFDGAHTFFLAEGMNSLWLASREVCTLATQITIAALSPPPQSSGRRLGEQADPASQPIAQPADGRSMHELAADGGAGLLRDFRQLRATTAHVVCIACRVPRPDVCCR